MPARASYAVEDAKKLKKECVTENGQQIDLTLGEELLAQLPICRKYALQPLTMQPLAISSLIVGPPLRVVFGPAESSWGVVLLAGIHMRVFYAYSAQYDTCYM